jgi:S-adenosylmethionine synthetase
MNNPNNPNNPKNYIFTSESVSEGHPDKMADQISDAILDYIVERDPNARVACETMISNGVCLVAGELKTETYVPIQTIAREVMKDIGYTDADYGCDYKSYGVLNGIGEQSNDISQGVDQEDGEIGAGDQGLMFGYACSETPELMPLPIQLAHQLSKKLADVRKASIINYLRPDAKTQVSVEYKNDIPVGIDTIVVSTQHDNNISLEELKRDVKREVIDPVVGSLPRTIDISNITYHINPTGRFVVGGPQGDAGLTGRKIIVDTYGGACPHGGGAFSGKDSTKVDRSGAYMMRYIAKNLVATGLASKVTLQVAYAIGVSEPVSVYVDTHGTSIYNDITDSILQECVQDLFDLTPKGIIETLELDKPIFRKTTNYGHFGREDQGFRWEKTDRVQDIKDYLAMAIK